MTEELTKDIVRSKLKESISLGWIIEPEKIALMKKVRSLANGARNLKDRPEYDRYFNLVSTSHISTFKASPLYELVQQRVDLQGWAQQYYDDAVEDLLLFVYEKNGRDFSKVSQGELETEVYQKASIETKKALEDAFGFIKIADPNNRREGLKELRTREIPAPDFNIPTL